MINKMKPNILIYISLATFIVVFFPSNAYAYIDPGTGSVIISAIIFSIATIGYYARVIILKIKNFFTNKK